MASVAKWLRQWFVVPPFVGSIPIIRPQIKTHKEKRSQSDLFSFLGVLTVAQSIKIARQFNSCVSNF